jgi:hypothetical protein
MRRAEPLAMSTHLWQMNDEVCYVKSPGMIVDLSSGQKMKPGDFTAHSQWSTASVPERIVGRDGSMSYEKTDAASTWIKWPLRNQVSKITYAPGQPRFVDDLYNEWVGWGVEPKKREAMAGSYQVHLRECRKRSDRVVSRLVRIPDTKSGRKIILGCGCSWYCDWDGENARWIHSREGVWFEFYKDREQTSTT